MSRTINFSLRQNKGIIRTLVFESLKQAQPRSFGNAVYVGLGSVWFQDFRLAHRELSINKMISIERHDMTYARARFNRPYGCIEVIKGDTKDILPELLSRSDLIDRPWVVWLDYDGPADELRLAELRKLVVSLYPGSALLTTFNADPKRYGADPSNRRQALADLLGYESAGLDGLKGTGWMRTLANGITEFLQAAAIDDGREAPFIPILSYLYKDSIPMLTIGGVLPDKSQVQACRSLVASDDWIGWENILLEMEPLTLREIQTLTRLLPAAELTREEVLHLGFDLPDAQLSFFRRHYLRYPIYVEMV